VFSHFVRLATGPKYGFATNSFASLVAFIYAGIHIPPALLALVARSRRWLFISFCINMIIVIIDVLITAYILVIANCSNSTNGSDCNWYFSTSTPFNTYIFSQSITDSFWPRIAAFFGACAFLSCCLCCCTCVPVADCCRRCFCCTRPDDGEEDPEENVVVAAVDGTGVTVNMTPDIKIQSFGQIELSNNPLAKPMVKW
jgi:hypothetical protein